MARLVAFALALSIAACYHAPNPACGFVCGENGACPGNYACAADNRCHLNGEMALCESAVDAGRDAVFDGGFIDAGFIDAAQLPFAIVVSHTPSDTQTGVAVNVRIEVLFAETVDFLSPESSDVTLVSGVDAPIVYAQGDDGGLVGIASYLQLAPSTLYTITLEPAFLDGYQIEQTSWTFTTDVDTASPTLLDEAPNGVQIADATTPIDLYFDEYVQGLDTTSMVVQANGTTVPGSIAYIDDGMGRSRHYQFTPTTGYPPASTVVYSLSNAITDTSPAANPLAQHVFSFTTM